MIETSYYKSPLIREKDWGKLASISLYPPNWESYSHLPELAPSKGILTDYKREKIDKWEYVERFKNQLDLLDPKEIYEKADNKIVMCYEKIGDFCHRHIVELWLREHGYEVREVGQPQRVSIIGSRGFIDQELGFRLISMLVYHYGTLIFNSGMALGADTIGCKFAYKYNFKLNEYPANWDKHGKSAGYVRNVEMCDDTDIVLAIWDGESKGTLHMIKECDKREKIVYVYDYKEDKYIPIQELR